MTKQILEWTKEKSCSETVDENISELSNTVEECSTKRQRDGKYTKRDWGNGNEELFEDNYPELLEDNNFHLPNIKWDELKVSHTTLKYI